MNFLWVPQNSDSQHITEMQINPYKLKETINGCFRTLGAMSFFISSLISSRISIYMANGLMVVTFTQIKLFSFMTIKGDVYRSGLKLGGCLPNI